MNGRILIAEDDTRIGSFVDKGLRANGFTTKVVADGESADVFARSGEFDLLVLDIGLPRRDGFTVLRRLREARVALPVIILVIIAAQCMVFFIARGKPADSAWRKIDLIGPLLKRRPA